MSIFRPLGSTDQGVTRPINPGDIIAGGESTLAGAITTAGAGTWLAPNIVTGIIARSGPTGAYTDTTDTAANIIAALAGSAYLPEVLNGTTFRFLVQNTVAFALTFAAGTGVVAGTGTLNIAASSVREYLLTVLNNSQPTQYQMAGNSGQVNLYLGYVVGTGSAAPAAPTMLPMFASNSSIGTFTPTPGATVTGTNIPANTTVLGLIQGVGGVIGVTLSANVTGAVNGAVSFTPTVKIDGLFSATL